MDTIYLLPGEERCVIFEMPMESRRYTTLTVPSVENFSTAPAAQRTKPSGCVKIGSKNRTATI